MIIDIVIVVFSELVIFYQPMEAAPGIKDVPP
jgi:hypothetical protein